MTRRKAEYTNRELSFGNVRLNGETFELSAVNSVRLSVKEFELMQALMTNAGHACETHYLFERVWRDEPASNENIVWVYVSYLRNKLLSVDADCSIDGERGGSFTLREGL